MVINFPSYHAFKLKLFHMCIECTDSLYLYIQRLVVEPNYYVLTVFIIEIIFAMISCYFPHTSTFLIRGLLDKNTFKNSLYIVSTLIHLYIFIPYMTYVAQKIDTYGNNTSSLFSSCICTNTCLVNNICTGKSQVRRYI